MSKKLIKYSINTTIEGEDIVASTLFSYNIFGCQIEDENFTNEDMINQYEEMPIFSNNTNAKVSFYAQIYDTEEEKNNDMNDFDFSSNVDNSYMQSNENKWTTDEINLLLYNIVKDLHTYEEYNYLGDLTIEKEDLTNFDYMNKWKEYFHKFYIDNICIKPSFEELDENDKDKIIINIDPKGAFGTGNHETTRMCVKSILKYKDKKNTLLDIGCGSGILGIVARKVGIKNIVSIDIDETIYETIKENLDINDVCVDNFEILFGNIIDDENFNKKIKEKKYDIIVANILSHIINKMIVDTKIYDMLDENGILILSGILNEKKDEVIKNIEETNSLKILEINEDGDWININCKKV